MPSSQQSPSRIPFSQAIAKLRSSGALRMLLGFAISMSLIQALTYFLLISEIGRLVGVEPAAAWVYKALGVSIQSIDLTQTTATFEPSVWLGSVRVQLLIVCAGALVVSLYLGFLCARSILKPMSELAAFTENLMSGKDEAVPSALSARDDEVGRIAMAIERNRTQTAQAYQTDPNTGLLTRESFSTRLEQACQQHDAAGLILIHIRRLTQISRLLGATQAEAVVRAAGLRVGIAEANLRAANDEAATLGEFICGRLGTDELAVLVVGGNDKTTRLVAEEIVRSFSTDLQLGGDSIDLTANIGIALHPFHSIPVSNLIGCATVAVNDARRHLQTISRYDATMHTDIGTEEAANSLSLLSQLRKALSNGELRLYLQPKVSAKDGSHSGAECLIRWQHPTRGMVPPGEFIPVAEASGFITEITLWVIAEACATWAACSADGRKLHLSVNLSAQDLVRSDLVSRIQQSSQRFGVPPEFLTLEITESAIATNRARAIASMEALKSHGYRLSIDDFGAGYTSLAQLLELPADEIKIDMLFTKGIAEAERRKSMLRSIIEIGKDQNLYVVVEGIEGQRTADILTELGADAWQGYYASRPLAVEDFLNWCDARALSHPRLPKVVSSNGTTKSPSRRRLAAA